MGLSGVTADIAGTGTAGVGTVGAGTVGSTAGTGTISLCACVGCWIVGSTAAAGVAGVHGVLVVIGATDAACTADAAVVAGMADCGD
jgi:hypothetical protein